MVWAVVAVVALLILGLAVAYWAVIRRRLGSRAIRTRLLWGFVLMATLPATAISVGTAAVGYSSGRRQAADRLQSVAARKELEIGSWAQSVQSDLATTLSAEYAMGEIGTVLGLARNKTHLVFFNDALRDRLRRYVAQSRFDELTVLSLTGQVVVSSDAALEGDSQADIACFQRGLSEPCTEATLGVDDRVQVRAVKPVIGLDRQTLGALACRVGTQDLGNILGERTGLEGSGKAYLVNAQSVLLMDSRSLEGAVGPSGAPRTVRSAGIDAALGTRSSGVALYDDYRGTPVVGVYRWLPDLQIALLVEQDQAEALQALTTTLAVSLAVVLACILMAIVASLGITRSIARPLVRLAGTAEQIAAGDLQQIAEVGGQDEVGALARAFNTMTIQLRDLIGRLEERVAERTQALERRALQLETSARVSREVTSILEVDGLLARVVDLIRSSFGYYHVSVYLVDRENATLALRADSGGTAPVHLQVPIGIASLNGRSALENRPVLVNRVDLEPGYQSDAHLPGTRSELAVPLRAGEQVLGTLDVHSSQDNAFSPEDLVVIQSLADQVAIAIENARLYGETRRLATLEERYRLARELHDSVTQLLYSLVLFSGASRRMLEARDLELAERQMAQLERTAQQALREMRLLLYQLRPAALEQEGLKGALQQRLDAVEERVGVQTRLVVEGVVRLAPDVEEGLYQIAQEALNNALKHAMARVVTVSVRALDDQVDLEVQDDGTGFEPDAVEGRGGLGLASMRERAAKIGGRLELVSVAGGGTTVRVEVPL
jgi:nitrate/nitrite-specific signal transduction histidine kinase